MEFRYTQTTVLEPEPETISLILFLSILFFDRVIKKKRSLSTEC